MTKRFNSLQKMLVLAHALGSVVDSDEFISSIDRLRKNIQHKKDSKGGLRYMKKLMDLLYAMKENVEQLQEHLSFVLEQEKTLCSYKCTIRPLSDEDITRIESAVLSQLNWLKFYYRVELSKNNMLFANPIKMERIIDYEELFKDDETQEVMSALADIIATLNMVSDIIVHINDIIDEITIGKDDSLLDLQLDMYCIINSHRRIYHHLFERLKKTSKYNENVILKYQHDDYRARFFLELMNYDVLFKPQLVFSKTPDKITFVYKSGYMKTLFQR